MENEIVAQECDLFTIRATPEDPSRVTTSQIHYFFPETEVFFLRKDVFKILLQTGVR